MLEDTVSSDWHQRLSERLSSLGVPMVLLSSEGHVTIQGRCPTVERLALSHMLFSKSISELAPQLWNNKQQALEMWPGLWLIPLKLPGQGPLSEWLSWQPLPVAVLFGHEFFFSQPFTRICQSHQLDQDAIIGDLAPNAIASEREARRLASMLQWMLGDMAANDQQANDLRQINQAINTTQRELNLLSRFYTQMVVGMQPDGFLQEACEQFQLMLGYRWLVLQVTENDPRLNDLAGRLFSAGSVNRDRVTLRRIGRELQTETRGVYEPIVRDDDFQNQPAPINEPTPRLLVIPLHHERDRLGILFGGQPLNQDPVDLRDANKCATLAAALTMFLKNMLLYGDMERVFMGALRALTTAIDAKDRYTHGHSERVALMARKLSLAAGFDTRTAERVYLSGLVHDLGKIGVPEAVLCKPGRLTDQEFDLIKLHPTIGARILSGIPQMTDLIPGVLHHHERWDGRGYPSGLSKREIPCFGRLLALADTFDAMSSSRSYREALKHEEVLEEIKRNIGTQFDPELAEIFLGLDFEPFFMLHRQQKMAENAAKSRLAG